MIIEKVKQTIRDIADFPKPGIVFKDITPLLKDPQLCKAIVDELAKQVQHLKIDAVAGIESRGFLFGMGLAQKLNVPFIPIRKAGKLPYNTLQQAYDLEYGQAVIEIHQDALTPGQQVLIHDDLLATGGTVVAASSLIEKLGANIVAYSFVISLDFLNGKTRLQPFDRPVFSLVHY